MKTRLVRLALVGGLALLASAPAAPASAFVCNPAIEDVCNTVCRPASAVCRLFG